jgi:hypothetical protein
MPSCPRMRMGPGRPSLRRARRLVRPRWPLLKALSPGRRSLGAPCAMAAGQLSPRGAKAPASGAFLLRASVGWETDPPLYRACVGLARLPLLLRCTGRGRPRSWLRLDPRCGRRLRGHGRPPAEDGEIPSRGDGLGRPLSLPWRSTRGRPHPPAPRRRRPRLLRRRSRRWETGKTRTRSWALWPTRAFFSLPGGTARWIRPIQLLALLPGPNRPPFWTNIQQPGLARARAGFGSLLGALTPP